MLLIQQTTFFNVTFERMPTRSKKTHDNSVLCPRTGSGPWQIPSHTDSGCHPRSRHFVATTRTDASRYATSCYPPFTGSAVDLPSTRRLPTKRLHHADPIRVFSSTDERQVAQYRPGLPALQKLGQFLIDYASRQTSFALSTNPLKSKWVRSSRVRRELTYQTRLWYR